MSKFSPPEGTAAALREGGIEVLDVSRYTESPEIMDGRVKTLHPRVHGGILMRDEASDVQELTSIGGKRIDMVVVNLYPFTQTLKRGAPHDEIIENIDIGGPSMLRSAAKNYERVLVVSDPKDYGEILEAIASPEGPSPMLRQRLAGNAFTHTAASDGAIAAYLTGKEDETSPYPGTLTLQFKKAYDTRYGENPHQRGAFYFEQDAEKGSLARAHSVDIGRKELSFNNLVDLDAALECVREFEIPAAVVVKHTNPCGVATAATLAQAYEVAREADAQSAFGGIVALNRNVDLATAEKIAETFIECVVAPEFEEDAKARLQKKKNLRLLSLGWMARRQSTHAPLQAY